MNWGLFFTLFGSTAWQLKWRLLTLLLITITLSALYVAIEKPSYKTSWIMLLPGTERSTSLSLDNIGEARSSGSNAYGSVSISPKNTYKEIALSDAVINAAAQEYGVKAEAFSKPRITLIDQTPAMTFTLKGRSYQDLQYRAKLYNNTFHQILDQLRSNEIERNYRGVEGNLSEAKRRLSEAREAIVRYQSENSIVSDTQFQAWLDEAHRIRTQKSQADVKRAALAATIDAELTQLGINADQAKAFLLVQSNPTTQDAMLILSEKLAKEASMKKVYAPQNPLRKQLSKEIAGIRTTLAANLVSVPELKRIGRPQLYALLSNDIGSSLKSVNQKIAELQGTDAEIQALETLSKTSMQRIKAHTQEAATFTDLSRDHQIAEAIFSSALAKLDTSRLDIYATYPLTQLLTQPGDTIKRDRLQTKLMIIALFLAYGLLATALILSRLRRHLNHGTTEFNTAAFNNKNINTGESEPC